MSTTPTIVDDRLDLSDYVRHVARHWLVVLVATVLGVGAGIGAAQIVPSTWSTQATLFVRADAPGSTLYERSQFAQQRVSSYAQLGTSPEVLQPVADERGVSLSRLSSRITVANPVDTAIVTVTATGATAEGAAVLADDVATSLAAVVDRLDSASGDDGQTVTLDLTAPAPVPVASSGPSAIVLVLLGLLFGLAGGIVVAILLARTRPRIDTVDDVRRATGLPVVGQLPGTVHRGDDPLRGTLSPKTRTGLREAVQNTRALRGGDLPSTLLLARTDSVREAAGVDGGLARAMVELGSSCALVQADFDTRTQSRPSTVPDDALPEEVEQDRGGYDRVPVPDVVTASTRTFVRTGADDFFRDLRENYDVTIVQASSDSHPLPLRSVTSEVDEVLLVVRSGVTTLEALRSLTAELMSLDVEPVGVVMTGVPRWRRVLLRATWRDEDFRRRVRSGPVSHGIASFATADDVAPTAKSDSRKRTTRPVRGDA